MTVSPATLPAGATRDYWNHPGGANCVWNTPLGDGCIWGVSTDADTVDLRHGGFVNTPMNYGAVVWVSKSSSDPTASFTGTMQNYDVPTGGDPINPAYDTVCGLGATQNGSGTTVSVTAHLVPGSYSAGPYPAQFDQPYCFVDTTGHPGLYYQFGSVEIQSFQAGQGPYNTFSGQAEWALSDNFCEDAETGHAGDLTGCGTVRGYDVDSTRNPARMPGSTTVTAIQHMLRFTLGTNHFKANANPSNPDYPNGPLAANSWPTFYQDFQGGATPQNAYTGNYIYGTTAGIPITTAMPSGLTTAGQQLWWTLQHYGAIPRGAGGDCVFFVDQEVPQSWINDAITDLPKIVPFLCPLRNQHQAGQDFTTNPRNGPGSNLDVGPPTLNIPSTSAPKPSPNDTVVLAGSGGSITDSGGNVWTITSTGLVAVNGIADTTTSNVIELAYVDGTIWQENSAGLWWSKTNPGGVWSPPAGTSTSPLPSGPAGVPPRAPVVTTGLVSTVSIALTWTSAAPIPTGSQSPDQTVVLAGSTAAITDAAGNKWTITAGAQVAVNGTADTTTANVAELAYVSGAVWQESTTALWWEKTSPSAAWSPNAGTSTSPLTMTYQVQYRVDGTVPWGNFGSPINVLSATVTGLTQATKYDFQVIATNPSGSVTSAAVTATTSTPGGGGGAVAPSAPLSLAASSITGTSLTLGWQASTGTAPISYQPQYRVHQTPTGGGGGGGTPGTLTPAGLISYFKSIAGTKTISGQMIERGPLTPVQTVETSTGFWVGLIGGDYWWFGSTTMTADTSGNPIYTSYWQNGGLLTLSFSPPNPTSGGYVQDGAATDAAGILQSGTTTNTNFIKIINSIGLGMQQLQQSGVVVIVRPFHESNGNWFWWGTKNFTNAQFIALWRYTHDYWINTMGLTNLVFLWGVNSDISGLPISGLYPGDAYVDMVGLDLYTSTPTDVSDYNAISAYGKPVCLSEFGSGSPSMGDSNFQESTLVNDISSSMPNMVFWQQWWNGTATFYWGMDQTQGVGAALALPRVINRGSIGYFTGTGGGTPASPNDTVVLAGSPNAIIDASGNKWTITSGGQVAVNGVADTTTSNVIELAYVNGAVWQESSAGLWWSKTKPTDAWSPTAGTTTSPLPASGGGGSPTVPGIPINLTVSSVATNSITLTWAAPTTGGVPTGYQVMYKTTSATSYTKVAAAVAAPAIITNTSGGSITDTSGNVWTITASGQVAVNGVADTTTANVIELIYVGGLMWQENSAGSWYSETGPGAGWSGPVTTAPSTTPTQTVTGLTASTSYDFEVYAFNTAGNGTVTAAVVGTTSSSTGTFAVSNGQIIGPNGQPFIARGINISDSNMGQASTNAQATPLTTLFQGINFIRLACYSYQQPSAYQTFINQVTALGIVVEFEDHTNSTGSDAGGGSGVVFTGTLLSNELTWYSNLASAYINNPHVWFGTDNEPPGPTGALSTWHQQTYNAIRGTGNNTIILIDPVGAGIPGQFGQGSGMTTSVYAAMRNVIWDFHQYSWLYNGQNNLISISSIQSQMKSFIQTMQTITSADGTMPVMCGEFGPSTTGGSFDQSGNNNVAAVLANTGVSGGLVGFAAWHWGTIDSFNNLSSSNSGGTLTAYGQTVANAIKQG